MQTVSLPNLSATQHKINPARIKVPLEKTTLARRKNNINQHKNSMLDLLVAFALVYTHFDMKHETATLLESRAEQSCEQRFRRYNKDQNEDLLDSMRYFIEAAEVHSSIDAGNKTRKDCAQASLLSLQIRMPDFQWLDGKQFVFGKVMDGYSVVQEMEKVGSQIGRTSEPVVIEDCGQVKN
ncbi:hypothetical protein KIW84_022224 [Lathyrus oleraceus]|uniref:PPIase cyclophilin-type domain-containing protein n=1 Tax=Pisum sativum TaxID=3888 RepID=A0A9D5B513_PEA|nr:hypothetical protein KIW84_022224 [Pisum sativum]